MNIPGYAKLSRGLSRVRSAVTRGPIVLLYHRIADPEIDSNGLSVSPRLFAEQLEVLKRTHHPIQMNELASQIESGSPSRGCVVLTFDDGYADNLFEAKPLLEKYEIPATVYVTSRACGNPEIFWWDRLEDLVLLSCSLPDRLEMEIGSRQVNWSGELADRTQLLSVLHRAFRPLDHQTQSKALDSLRHWAGEEAPDSGEPNVVLSRDEVSLLDEGEFVDVGAHTRTHPLLTACEASTQYAEILESKSDLERILGHPVSSFAYPFGDHDKNIVSLVRKAGFETACTVFPGTVWRRTNPLLLPRFTVRDWDGERFAREFSKWS